MGEKRLFFRSNCAIHPRLAPLSAQQTLVSLAIHPEPLTWYLASKRDLEQAMFMPYRYLASKEECPEWASGTGGKEWIHIHVYLMS